MYLIGHLSGINAALMADLTVGILETLVTQMIMHAFYYLIEKPPKKTVFSFPNTSSQ